MSSGRAVATRIALLPVVPKDDADPGGARVRKPKRARANVDDDLVAEEIDDVDAGVVENAGNLSSGLLPAPTKVCRGDGLAIQECRGVTGVEPSCPENRIPLFKPPRSSASCLTSVPSRNRCRRARRARSFWKSCTGLGRTRRPDYYSNEPPRSVPWALDPLFSSRRSNTL